MKKLMTLILLTALLMNLAACTVAPTQSSSRTFTDDAGRTVALPQQITRIVASAPMAQIVLLTLAPELLVGTASRLNDNEKAFLPSYLSELPYLGSLYAGAELNVEELALTEAQLIIDIGEPKDSTADDLDALQKQTLIPSVYLSATLESMPALYRKLGSLLDREERAEQLACFCERVYDRTLSIMDKVGQNKVRCLYVLGEDGLNVIARGSYHAQLLDLLTENLAVVDNPLGKGTGNAVTMEQISLWDPDFVIFAPQSIYDTVTETPSWNQMSAIISGNYVKAPDAPYNYMGMPPSVQRYLGLIWLTYVLYPQYCEYDVKAEICEFYELFFGCTLTDAQYGAVTEGAFLQ